MIWTYLGAFVAWYLLSRIGFRVAYCYLLRKPWLWFDRTRSATADIDNSIVGVMYLIPVVGEFLLAASMIYFSMTTIGNASISLNQLDSAVIKFAEKKKAVKNIPAGGELSLTDNNRH